MTERWYASGGGLLLLGPFPSQREAYKGMRLTSKARDEQRILTGIDMPYPRDVVVWPEYEDER